MEIVKRNNKISPSKESSSKELSPLKNALLLKMKGEEH